MTDSVVVARLFTAEQAVEVCKQLNFAGIGAKFQSPVTTGNYFNDWNMQTPEFRVFVQEEDAVAAQAALSKLQEQEDPSDSAPQRTPPPSPLTKQEETSARIKSAMNMSIGSSVLSPLAPFAIYRILGVLRETRTRQDNIRLSVAVLFAIIGSVLLAQLVYFVFLTALLFLVSR